MIWVSSVSRSRAPPTAADKGEVFLFQKITSVWLTDNRRDKEFALDIVSFGNNLLFLRLLESLFTQTRGCVLFAKANNYNKRSK